MSPRAFRNTQAVRSNRSYRGAVSSQHNTEGERDRERGKGEQEEAVVKEEEPDNIGRNCYVRKRQKNWYQ